MIFTSSNEIDENLRKLRVHGAIKDYHHQAIGLNSRLDEIQAAVLRVKLPHLDTWSENRRQNAALYNSLFENSSVITPVEDDRCYHVYNQYVVRIPNRDDTLKKFREKEIGCSVYYPVPLHLQECFAYLGYSPNDFPESEIAARETLALPIFSGLTADEIRTIADVVLSMN
jgi:dTDP-4-amino-4,6-dideoxygalactose transaminase